MTKTITLSQGNGGEENNELIKKIFFEHFGNPTLLKCEDSAIIGSMAVTTDSFTVKPIFFNGGDIGKLAVCGTCNDLAMMGARPKYLTCSFIIEEGFSVESLEKIVLSMKKELCINGAQIITGDTKVVPKNALDGIFINTTGIGEVEMQNISSNSISTDDLIIVSGDIGRHGACIFAQREGIDIKSALQSDCASLWLVVEELIKNDIKITAMRDATRGGLSAVLNEWAKQSNICIEVEEKAVPISKEVQGICELLGFEAYNLANEGTFALAVKKEDAQKALEILKKFEICKNAQIIAKVSNEYSQKVVLNNEWGSKRFLDMPTGELLPRIC
ncbi:MAG: hydrogenase expression/formation protein HypE [Campylobacterota bacterium]|nr:hydrogenase expression/formation protein HypE [Campylobacterota bacterium]